MAKGTGTTKGRREAPNESVSRGPLTRCASKGTARARRTLEGIGRTAGWALERAASSQRDDGYPWPPLQKTHRLRKLPSTPLISHFPDFAQCSPKDYSPESRSGHVLRPPTRQALRHPDFSPTAIHLTSHDFVLQPRLCMLGNDQDTWLSGVTQNCRPGGDGPSTPTSVRSVGDRREDIGCSWGAGRLGEDRLDL
jgi:hypothetical protein